MLEVLKKLTRLDIKELLLYLVILTIPLANESGLLTVEFGFTILPSYLFGLAGIIFMVLDESEGIQVFNKLDIAFILFFAAIAVSVVQIRLIKDISSIPMSKAVSIFNNYPYARSLTQVTAIGFMMLIYYFVVNVVKDEKKLKKAITLSIVTATLCSIYGLTAYTLVKLKFLKIVDFLGSITGNSPPVFIFFERGPRIQSTFSEPLIFGTYILSVLPVTFMILFTTWFKHRWLLVFAFIFQITSVILTFSRSAWLGLIIIFLISIPMLIVKKKYLKKLFNKKNIVIYTLIIFILILTFSMFLKKTGRVEKLKELTVDQIKVLTNLNYFIESNRINSSGDNITVSRRISSLEWSTMMRINDIVAGINMLKAHPFLGVGWGNYIYNYLDYDPRLMGWWWIRDMPHTDNRPGTPVSPNLFVTVLAESGVIGFTTFVLVILFLISYILKAMHMGIDSVDNEGLIAAGYLISIIAVLICYNFFSTFYYTFVWGMFGMAMAVANITFQKNMIMGSKKKFKVLQ